MGEPGVKIVFVDFVFEVNFWVNQANNEKELETLVEGHEEKGQAEYILEGSDEGKDHPVEQHFGEFVIKFCLMFGKNDSPKNPKRQNCSLIKYSQHGGQKYNNSRPQGKLPIILGSFLQIKLITIRILSCLDVVRDNAGL